MCGIAGILGFAFIDNVALLLRQMAYSLRHRGPDDEGIWTDVDGEMGLAHRRLSILDLSPSGHQPMLSKDGRLVIVFNGEIYNHQELRAEIDASPNGTKWRGHSDTETLVEAISRWGLDRTLRRVVGMFAFGLWDRDTRCLHLARDRLGEKPLYYGWIGKSFAFGSEMKALRAHPAWSADIDRGSLALMVRHNYVPSPYTIYRGIAKLPPGTVLTVRHPATSPSGVNEVAPRRYWSALAAASNGVAQPSAFPAEDLTRRLEAILRDAVSRQMVADVPLGAFLSGGVDSSTVVALMQAQSARPIKTFTIGFHEADFDEASYAREVAAHLGTEHTELYVTPREAMDVVPLLPHIYDEPFSDSSQIPTYLVSRLARSQVTVSLSGDGGDELFGGYNRYFWGRDLWRRLGWIPTGVRSWSSRAIEAVSPHSWDRLYALASLATPIQRRQRAVGDKAHKLAEIIAARDPEDMYRLLISHWKQPEALVIDGREHWTALSSENPRRVLCDHTQRMMLLDTVSYLPDDILVKVDRAAMAVSLESRVPFLDHRVVEFAWAIPQAMKVRNGIGKWILREVLYKYVPKSLIERPKQGFAVPIDTWLRGPLREWAEGLLATRRLEEEGYFNPRVVRSKWKEHLTGRRNWQYLLWDVLMFEAWLDHQRKTSHV